MPRCSEEAIHLYLPLWHTLQPKHETSASWAFSEARRSGEDFSVVRHGELLPKHQLFEPLVKMLPCSWSNHTTMCLFCVIVQREAGFTGWQAVNIYRVQMTLRGDQMHFSLSVNHRWTQHHFCPPATVRLSTTDWRSSKFRVYLITQMMKAVVSS